MCNKTASLNKVAEQIMKEDPSIQIAVGNGVSEVPYLFNHIELLANELKRCSHLKCQLISESINAAVARLRVVTI
jgi:hypothetical protein